MTEQSILSALSDDDVSVRVAAINRVSEIATEEGRAQVFEKVIDDFHHEVREAAANQISIYPKAYKRFLSDPDPRVRIIIVNNSVKISEALNDPKSVVSALDSLKGDSVPEVRRAVALILHSHSPRGQTEEDRIFVLEGIVPAISALLSDKSDDVRIAASKNVKKLTQIFGFDFIFEQMYNSLHLMLTDPQWRVRNNAVKLMFGLALVCSADFFNQSLFPFLVQFLRDPCSKVRKFVIDSLPALASHFGEEWLKTNLVESLKTLAESQNFLHRQTYLLAISSLLDFFPVQYQSNYVFQPMIRMLKDGISNVVLLAIELLSKHRNSIHPFRRQYELKPILETLVENSPPTIKAKAQTFIQELQ